MRQAGILMPVSCLSSSYGIGDFGESAYQFLDIIKDAGFSIWQILPLNPLGKGNSPYQPISSFAMDEIYISPSKLYEMGLIQELPDKLACTRRISYPEVRSLKESLLEEAVSRFEKNEEYEAFKKQYWVNGYAMYKILKKNHQGEDWTHWPEAVEFPSFDEIEKEIIIQFLLRSQWNQIHDYAKEIGITILGDLPFYVGLDSVDVWLNQEEFLLENNQPTVVAGVPGDYFNPDGQKWGNPLYDWQKMEENDFSFWVERLQATSEIYDIVRIDHFRAFDTYWVIPEDAENANQGEWREAPGYHVLQTITEKLPTLELVAEDLGYMREEVYQLRDDFGLKGMRIVQYSLDHLEFPEDPINRIVYSGTHDNIPLKAWFPLLSEDVRIPLQEALTQKGYQEDTIVKSIMSYVLESNADIAVLSIVDVLELDGEDRINAPGTCGDENWTMHCESLESLKAQVPWLKEKINNTKRRVR